jgi:hypothetical protein
MIIQIKVLHKNITKQNNTKKHIKNKPHNI